MGCCSSSHGSDSKTPMSRTLFDEREPESMEDVVYKARCQGPRSVHVTGRVVHAGSVFEAPFSGDHCLMVHVVVLMCERRKPKSGKPLRPLSSGGNQLGFKIISTTDGRTQEILIEPGLWEMFFERRHVLTDIRLDSERDMLVCRDSGKKVRELPKAKNFWDRFIHEIGPVKVPIPDVKDKKFKGLVEVHEYSLTEGDVVAVLGRVKVNDGIVIMDASGHAMSMITNKPSKASSILRCPPGITPVMAKPQVVGYSQASE